MINRSLSADEGVNFGASNLKRNLECRQLSPGEGTNFKKAKPRILSAGEGKDLNTPKGKRMLDCSNDIW